MSKVLSLVILSSLVPFVVSAHPGNTDASGCHTCRTNCAKWGLSQGEYHCHNSKGIEQPKEPVRSSATGVTVPAPEYKNPTVKTVKIAPVKVATSSVVTKSTITLPVTAPSTPPQKSWLQRFFSKVF